MNIVLATTVERSGLPVPWCLILSNNRFTIDERRQLGSFDWSMSAVLPVLLGRVRNALTESEKGRAADAEDPETSTASSQGLDEISGQDSWIQRCCRRSAAFLSVLLVTLITYFVSEKGWVFRYLSNDASSWALGFITLLAGWTACWLWLIAPTAHILLTARFLLVNWCGGLFALFFFPQQRVEMMLSLELLFWQYLAQLRLKSLWPALRSPRWGACLNRLFWLELGLICCSLTALPPRTAFPPEGTAFPPPQPPHPAASQHLSS